ncbi:MAG: hypothetical protein V2B17_08015, partial [Chloroflexota bacterium]
MADLTRPQPPADDEVARRLAALKAGADPTSFADDTEAARPAVAGEVLDDGRGWAPRGDRPAGQGAGRPGTAGLGVTGAGQPCASGAGTPPPGPAVRAVFWGISQAEAGRLGLWTGLALVAFGGYLVLASFVPAVAVLGSVVLAILGGALVAWHLAGRAGAWAVHAGMVLAGFGAARLVADAAGLPSAGWGSLGAGFGLLVIAAVRVTRGEGIRWQAWVGGALAVFGGWGVLGATIPGFPTLGDLIVPVVLVLIGVAVLRRGVREG